MTPGDRIREFCAKYGLTQEERDYLLGVLGEAVLLEREACAKVAESTAVLHGDHYGGYAAPSNDGADIAAAIRARKEP